MILHLQKYFQENDLVDGKIIEFFNIFDKGYFQVMQARTFDQRCMTPPKSDIVADNGDALLRAAGVAVARSGNERGVNRCKVSNFIKLGMKQHIWDIDFFCDVFEAWSFRVNFMYQGFQ